MSRIADFFAQSAVPARVADTIRPSKKAVQEPEPAALRQEITNLRFDLKWAQDRASKAEKTISELSNLGIGTRCGAENSPMGCRPFGPAPIKYVYVPVVEPTTGTCAYCEAVGPIHFDHVIPRSRRGGHGPRNMVPACVRCNLCKSDRTPSEWGTTAKWPIEVERRFLEVAQLGPRRAKKVAD